MTLTMPGMSWVAGVMWGLRPWRLRAAVVTGPMLAILDGELPGKLFASPRRNKFLHEGKGTPPENQL